MFDSLKKDETRLLGEVYEQRELNNALSRKKKEDPYVALARESLEYYLKHKKKMPKPEHLIDDLKNNKAGVFVSIHKFNQLRGCVGTIKPTTGCIASEIIQNAVSAGIRDNRFTPIRKRELSVLQYKVDVLLPSESIESKEELDVKKYGVIVFSNYKSGLLLPNLEGIDNESFRMERFEVIRHS